MPSLRGTHENLAVVADIVIPAQEGSGGVRNSHDYCQRFSHETSLQLSRFAITE